MDLALTIIGAVAAVAASVAAFGSWKAARQANRTAASLEAIERDRRHDELTPEFEITCKIRRGAPDSADLRVILAGGRISHLDEVTVTVLDETDKDHWAHGLPSGITQEEAEAFVWGPWEFNAAATAQVVSNRQSKPRPYSRPTGRNWDILSMTRTRPGRWMGNMTPEQWQWQQSGPLRLLLTCVREGYDPWFVQADVTAEEVRVARARYVE